MTSEEILCFENLEALAILPLNYKKLFAQSLWDNKKAQFFKNLVQDVAKRFRAGDKPFCCTISKNSIQEKLVKELKESGFVETHYQDAQIDVYVKPKLILALLAEAGRQNLFSEEIPAEMTHMAQNILLFAKSLPREKALGLEEGIPTDPVVNPSANRKTEPWHPA